MSDERGYPYEDGDVIVLGPEVFVASDGAVLCWRGENYVRQPAAPFIRAPLEAENERLTRDVTEARDAAMSARRERDEAHAEVERLRQEKNEAQLQEHMAKNAERQARDQAIRDVVERYAQYIAEGGCLLFLNWFQREERDGKL